MVGLCVKFQIVPIHSIVFISSNWKNKLCPIICVIFYQNSFRWYWIPWNSTVFNTTEFHGIQYLGKIFGKNWHKLLHKPYFFILMKWKQYRANSGQLATIWNLTPEPYGYSQCHLDLLGVCSLQCTHIPFKLNHAVLAFLYQLASPVVWRVMSSHIKCQHCNK